MDETLGLSVGKTPDYKRLKEKTTQLANHSTSYKTTEGDNDDDNRSTIIVQLGYINKLLRRYWVSVIASLVTKEITWDRPNSALPGVKLMPDMVVAVFPLMLSCLAC